MRVYLAQMVQRQGGVIVSNTGPRPFTDMTANELGMLLDNRDRLKDISLNGDVSKESWLEQCQIILELKQRGLMP